MLVSGRSPLGCAGNLTGKGFLPMSVSVELFPVLLQEISGKSPRRLPNKICYRIHFGNHFARGVLIVEHTSVLLAEPSVVVGFISVKGGFQH